MKATEEEVKENIVDCQLKYKKYVTYLLNTICLMLTSGINTLLELP